MTSLIDWAAERARMILAMIALSPQVGRCAVAVSDERQPPRAEPRG